MSADRQALLDALREEPDNDRLRLVYADWLEDNHDSDRAEYIRLCWERSGLDDDDPFVKELDRRRRQLYRKHRQNWGPGLPAVIARRLEARGLVQSVECTASAFLKCADSLVGEPVARVKLTSVGKHIPRLLDSPALTGVRELILADSNLSESAVKTLADSPRLRGLGTLRLISCKIVPEKAALLADSPHLVNLRTLDLGHYERRDGDPNNAMWRNLAVSGLSYATLNQLGDEGLAAIADSPHLAGLETLIVSNGWISSTGANRLWSARQFKNLRHLDISYNYLHADGVHDLVASPLMKHLTTLEIQANEVGAAGVRALAESSSVRGLTLLDIAGSPVLPGLPLLNNQAAELLAGSRHLGKLEHLILSHNQITAKGAEALAKSTTMKSLRTLLLGNNRIGDRGAKAFASSELLKQLTMLDLTACSVGDAGAKALSRSKTAGDQLVLDLLNNPLSEQAIDTLVERFGERVTATTLPDQDESAGEEMPF